MTTLHDFNLNDGSSPVAGLIQGVDGQFYGTTAYGGTGNCSPFNGCGTIFSITNSGVLTTLHDFDGSDGEEPYGPMVQAMDKSLYGTALAGGVRQGVGNGTIFKIAPSGKLTTIQLVDGRSPAGQLVQATDGSLYGTTYYGGDFTCNAGIGCGAIFELRPEGQISILHSFQITDGMGPYAGVLQGTDGNFYGTTYLGGPDNDGTVYSLDIGLGPFVTFIHAAGKVGPTSGILGQSFTGTTAVSLNGAPMTFKVVSDTYLTATVPPGATTGHVSVTTPSGVLTSNVPFYVIP